MNLPILSKKAQVILRSLVTWLSFVMFVLVLVADQVGQLFSGDVAQAVVTWLVRLGAWIGAAISIIRRVSPVGADEVGILPVDNPQ